MGKKGLVSIFSRLVVDSSSPAAGPPATPPWPWTPCGTSPQTASFRAGDEPCCAPTTTAAGCASRCPPAATTAGNTKLMPPGEMYKTVNSVYVDDSAADVDLFSVAGDETEEGEVPDDDVHSFSTTTASEEWSEAVIRSLGRTSTDRFFFDAGPLPASNSILATSSTPSPPTKPPPAPLVTEAKKAMTETEADGETPPDDPDDDGGGGGGDEEETQQQPCKSLAEGSVAVAVDSGDPYGDFRASMEEMVAAHGLRDWAALEELLACYLRINGKHHHHLIVGAFVDLLLGLASSSPSDATATSSSSSSGSACAGSRCTTSTSTSTSTAATTSSSAATATAAAAEQCGVGDEGVACCCSSSSSCAAEHDVDQDDVAEEEEEEEKAHSAAATGDDRATAAASAPLRVP